MGYAFRAGLRFEDDLDDRDKFTAAVKRIDDDDYLHLVGLRWFEALGRLALDDYRGRSAIGKRLKIIDDRRAALTAPADTLLKREVAP